MKTRIENRGTKKFPKAQRAHVHVGGREVLASRTGPDAAWVCRFRGTTFYYFHLSNIEGAVRNAAKGSR